MLAAEETSFANQANDQFLTWIEQAIARDHERMVVANVANANHIATPSAHVVWHPAAIVALWTKSVRCRFFRLDLLHAIMDRLPVIGDWFRHLRGPPAMRSLRPQNLQQSA